MAPDPPFSCCLLDVLEQLPRDVLRTELWLKLADIKDEPTLEPAALNGRAFRLVSKRSLRLSDQLTRRLKLVFGTFVDGYHEVREVKSHSAFLARQEGLKQLSLADNSDSHGDGLLMKTLTLGGDAVCQQLHVLRLDTAACTAAAARCIQLCCPNIRELALFVRQLDSSSFSHLRTCQGLTKVTISTPQDHSNAIPYDAVFRSLSLLPSLRLLAVQGLMSSGDTLHLAHLTGLEQLHLGRLIIDAAPDDGTRLGQALACLTRLTQLIAPDCGTAIYSGAVVDAAMAQLAPLRRLASFAADNPLSRPVLGVGYATMCSMTALTRLSCPAAHEQPLAAGSGCLPLLQQLRIRSDTGGSELAAMLRPLQPLPQLRDLFIRLRLQEESFDAENNDDDDDNLSASNGAWHVSHMLAAAPQLQQISLMVIGQDRWLPTLTGPATALLTPLRALLTDLRLLLLPAGALDALLPLLCLAGRLATLGFRKCHLSGTLLPLAVQHLPALRRLQIDNCSGVTVASALEVAALRVHPMHLVWLPDLGAAHRQQFHAAARAGVTVGLDWLE